ncbi:hypothetical protein EV121DRAFT_281347 [Schizophyllum commune]
MSSAPRKKERSSDGSTRFVCKLPGCEKPTWPNDREIETARSYHHQRYQQESARIIYQGRSVEIRRDPATGKFACPCGEPQHARRMAINTRTLCRPQVHPPPDTPSAGEAATDDEGFGVRRATGTQSSAGGGAGSQSSAGTRVAQGGAGASSATTPLPRKRRRGSPEVIEVGSDSDDGGTVLRRPTSPKPIRRTVSASPDAGDAPEARTNDEESGGNDEDMFKHQEPEVERELTLEEKFERNKALERKLHEQLDKQYEAYQEKLRAMEALMS